MVAFFLACAHLEYIPIRVLWIWVDRHSDGKDIHVGSLKGRTSFCSCSCEFVGQFMEVMDLMGNDLMIPKIGGYGNVGGGVLCSRFERAFFGSCYLDLYFTCLEKEALKGFSR
jgi:hypothetical protein